jgi:hypothetical protein
MLTAQIAAPMSSPVQRDHRGTPGTRATVLHHARRVPQVCARRASSHGRHLGRPAADDPLRTSRKPYCRRAADVPNHRKSTQSRSTSTASPAPPLDAPSSPARLAFPPPVCHSGCPSRRIAMCHVRPGKPILQDVVVGSHGHNASFSLSKMWSHPRSSGVRSPMLAPRFYAGSPYYYC